MTAPLDLDGLEKLCKEATPGPWRSDSCGDVFTINESVPKERACGTYVFRTIGTTPTGPDPGDGSFIAAANPTTVLALIARVRELELNDSYSGVHTCHANCKKWYCLLRKENDSLREKLKTAEEALEYCCMDDSMAADPIGNFDVQSANEWKKMKAKEALARIEEMRRKG